MAKEVEQVIEEAPELVAPDADDVHLLGRSEASGEVVKTLISAAFAGLIASINLDGKADLSGDTFTGDVFGVPNPYGVDWNESERFATEGDLYDIIETLSLGGPGGGASTTRVHFKDDFDLDMAALEAAYPTGDVEVLVTEQYTFPANKTTQGNLIFVFEGAGSFNSAGGVTLITIGAMRDPGPKKIFFGNAEYRLGLAATDKTDFTWWGGKVNLTVTNSTQWGGVTASLNTNKGGKLFIGNCRYKKGAFTISLPAGTTVIGTGVSTDLAGGSIIELTADNQAVFTVEGNTRYVSVEGMGFDMAAALTNGVGILFTGTFPNSTFANSFRNNVFYGGTEGIFVNSTDNVWETYFRAEGNWFLFQNNAGFRMNNVNAGITFIDNQFTPNYGPASTSPSGVWLERCGQVDFIGNNNWQGLGAGPTYAYHTDFTYNKSTGLCTTVGAVNHQLPTDAPHIVLIKTTGTLPPEFPTWEPETGYIITVGTYYAYRVSATTFTLHHELEDARTGANPILSAVDPTGTATLRTTILYTEDRPFAAIKVTGLFSQINIFGGQGEGFPYAMWVEGVGVTEAVINIYGQLPQGLIKFAPNTTVTVNDYGSKQGARAYQDSGNCFVEFNFYGARNYKVLGQYYDAGSTISPARLVDKVGYSSIRWLNTPEEGIWIEHQTVNMRATAGFDALFGHLPLMKLWRGMAGKTLIRIGQGPDKDVKYNGYSLDIADSFDPRVGSRIAGWKRWKADNVDGTWPTTPGAGLEFSGHYLEGGLLCYGPSGNALEIQLTSAATVTIDPKKASKFWLDHAHDITFVLTALGDLLPGQDIWICIRNLDGISRTHTFSSTYFRSTEPLVTGTTMGSWVLHFMHWRGFNLLMEASGDRKLLP